MNDYKPYRCSCCHRQLGLTNGARLLFVLGEGAYSDEPVPLKCVACGKRSYWRPAKKVDSVITVSYTELVPA